MKKIIKTPPTNNQTQSYSDRLVSLFLAEISNYEQGTIKLSNRVEHSMYNVIQNVKTHQNRGFLTELAPGQNDDREFYDIVTPAIETAISNVDIDTANLEPYTELPEHESQQEIAKSILQRFLMNTNHGTKLNEEIEDFIDDGNIIARRVEGSPDIYEPVLPQNIILGDISAKSLEDTMVMEKDTINQTELRVMKEWKQIDKVIDECNAGSDQIPFYETYFRYGEMSKELLGNVKKEAMGVEYKPEADDIKIYVQTLTIMVRAITGKTRAEDSQDANTKATEGIIVFAEELIPKTIKITKRLKITRYKPYESARLGKYTGRFWGMGYREIGMPYQNRANELGNQIRGVMKIASKILFWSPDESIAGKNILSAVKNGQIIKTQGLNILNNVFPNLSLFAEEWNRNITELTKALKAFEIASGESLPSSTSATAIAIQNEKIGLYYNYKREKFALWKTAVFSRWVIPDLVKDMKADEIVQITGDSSYIEKMVDSYLNTWAVTNYMKMIALTPNGGSPTKEEIDFAKQTKKEEILKKPKLFLTIEKDFFKDVDLYMTIIPTNEMFNKQMRIANGLKIMEYRSNPAIMQDPGNQERLVEIEGLLGFKPIKYRAPAMAMPNNNTMPNKPNNNLPMKEPSATEGITQ